MTTRSEHGPPDSRKEGRTEKEKTVKSMGVDEEPEKRSLWSNQFQFILSALGLAVGLGNIWRFPFVAYENGGSAFLIPYLFCGFFFGLPMVYAEFMIGQYSRRGPGLALGNYAAGFRGIGWSMTINSITLTVYYCLIIAWCAVYFGWVVSGESWRWTECNNDWNTQHCVRTQDIIDCRKNNVSLPYFYNGTCTEEIHKNGKAATEEFFTNWMTTRSGSITEGNLDFNWPILGALSFLWLLTCAILIKGIKIMGYLSYVIVPFPYIVVFILFARGVSLPGAKKGIDYYLLKPDFSKLWVAKTWAAALKQLMFSMNIGYGGLISLSSYNKPNNFFFSDVLIIIFGDTLMSLVGGVASFAILGYLSEITGKTIPQVVDSGPGLAFIVYPEAISTMNLPWLWNGLFFLMLFALGISSEVALVETFTGLVFDLFPSTRKRGWIVTVVTCTVCLAAGIPLCTKAGFYWFSVQDDFFGSTCSCFVAAAEVLVISFYGWNMISQDLEEIRGPPRSFGWTRWFTWRSPIFAIFWALLCPALAMIIFSMMIYGTWKGSPYKIQLDKWGSVYEVPGWTEAFGWIVSLGSILPVFLYFAYKWWRYRQQQLAFHYLFRPTPGLPSYDRYYEQKKIRPPVETGPSQISSSSDIAPGPLAP